MPSMKLWSAIVVAASASRTVVKDHKYMPGYDDAQFGDGFEHGSRETEVTQSNSADFSIHQYLVRDDARDGPATSGEDTAMEIRRQQALKAADHFNSEDTPDPDATLLQRKASHKQFPGDEQFGDGYEHGSRETEVTQSNAADFSIHQYLVRDDARDGPATSGEDTAMEIRRQKALKAADHFNSEDTPDPDATLLQRKAFHKQFPGDEQFGDGYEHGSRETEVTQSNAADFSIHQYLVRDDARDGPATSGEDTAMEIRRQKALKAADHFNSEDTPDPDATLLQLKRKASHKQFPGEDQFGDGYEHGSRETEVTQSNAADFSIHQYLVRDDARDGPATSGEDTAMEIRRQKALKAADHFNSEDTPDPDATLLQRKASHKQFPGDEQFGDGFEHGSRETEVTQSNAADFSIHQYLVRDDARDGPATSGEDTAFEIRRQKALKAADHFNSEDTPDPDATLLQRQASRKKQMPGDDQYGDGYEHGSREAEVTQANAADFSVHQFLVRDDAREGPVTSGEDTATEIRRQKALAAQDHFNSEDTPDNSF